MRDKCVPSRISLFFFLYEKNAKQKFSARNPFAANKTQGLLPGIWRYLERNIFSFGNQREFICVLLTFENKWHHATPELGLDCLYCARF